MDAEDGLEVTIDQILMAFSLAKDHTASARSHKQFLHNRWDVTLSILDRALMESDRGVKLLELTNKLSAAEAELDALRKGQGGGIVSWPLP